MCRDALARDESCGCHFRVEHQTAGGRGAPRRRRLRPRGGVVARARAAPGASPSRCLSRRWRLASGRIDEARAAHLASTRPAATPAASSATSSTICRPTRRCWRRSTASTSGWWAAASRRSPSTATAAKASAAPAASWWTVARTGRCRGRRPVSCRCARSATARRSRSSRFATGVFPVLRDLWSIAARSTASSQAGGYVSVRAGSAPEANALPSPTTAAERRSMPRPASAAAPAWPPAPTAPPRCSSAPSSRTSALAPGPARTLRAAPCAMIAAADGEGFGGCTLHGECQAACPKGIDLGVIARMNRDYLAASPARWWGGDNSRHVAIIEDSRPPATHALTRCDCPRSGAAPRRDRCGRTRTMRWSWGWLVADQ